MGENQVQQGLYSQSFEHDNCGIGAVVNIKGRKDHQIVADALKIVEQLEHRAGKDAEGKTGDGVGILTQISHRFFSRVCQEIGIELGGEREYGIGMFFFPQNELKRSQAKKMFEIIVEKEGMKFLGWREVPTAPEVLGHKARECMSFARALSKSRKILQQGWTLTESSMWYAAYLSRVTIIPMCRPYRAGPSCIRVCFWWDS